jgi:apolipoprotein N-acyltransferase
MRSRMTGLLVGGLSGALASLAFPPFALWPLAFPALVPLFMRVRATEGRRVVLPFLAFALVHFGTGLYWLTPVITPIGVVLLAAIIWVLFTLPMGLTLGFLVRRGIPLALAAPVVWVAFDWLRTWLLYGFPWLYLSHSQADFTMLIQVADLTGAFGVTALVVFVNAALAAALRRRFLPAGIAVGLIALVLVYGALRPGTVGEREGPSVLLVQACIPQGEKREVREGEKSTADVILDSHLSLTRKGVAEHPEVEVVIWPETMFPFRIDDRPGLDPRRVAYVRSRLGRIAAAAGGRPVVFGALYRTEDGESRNSVFLLDERGEIAGRYDKRQTVPGGEHVPLYTVLPPSVTRFIGETIAKFSGYVPDLTEGEEPASFRLAGARFTPLICYEIIYPALVNSTMALDPDVLLNLSNYAWYPETHQPEQAEDITIFRAVENRRPVVVSANNGISSVIDARGRVRSSVARDVTGALAARVPLTDAGSLYARVGDLFAILASCFTVLLAVAAVYWKRRFGNRT